MKLETIVTMASEPVRIQFNALERSLRASGCDLPLRVIPFDEAAKFDLPPNASWWKDEQVAQWLSGHNYSTPMVLKYQCLLIENYHFFDADICVLQNPAKVLEPYEGWLTSCNEWRGLGHVATEESKKIFAAKDSTWQRKVFNGGQYACDRQLYEFEELREVVDRYPDSCIHREPYYAQDQTGLNLLVSLKDVPVTNLTLPPYNRQSSFAIDYSDDPRRYWQDPEHAPYLMHWAGDVLERDVPVNEIFYSFLTKAEKEEWDRTVAERKARFQQQYNSLRTRAGRFKLACRSFVNELKKV